MSSVINCSLSPLVIPKENQYYFPPRVDFCMSLYILLVVSSIVLPITFFWAKRYARYERLRIRRTVLVVSASLCCLVHAQVGPGYVTFGIGNFPCWLRSFLTMLIIPLFSTSLTMRLLTFFFLSELSREISGVQLGDIHDPNLENASVCLRISRALSDVFYASYCLVNPTKTSINISKPRLIEALSFAASAKGALIVFLLIFLPFLVVALIVVFTDQINVECKGCSLSNAEIIEIIVVGVFFIIFGTLAAIRVRHYPDPWELRRESSWILIFGVISLIGFILATYANPGPYVVYDQQLIIVLGLIGFLYIQTLYQVIAAQIREKKTFSELSRFRAKRFKRANNKLLASVLDESQNARSSQASNERLTIQQVLQTPPLLEAGPSSEIKWLRFW